MVKISLWVYVAQQRVQPALYLHAYLRLFTTGHRYFVEKRADAAGFGYLGTWAGMSVRGV